MAHPGLKVQCLLPWCVPLAQAGGVEPSSSHSSGFLETGRWIWWVIASNAVAASTLRCFLQAPRSMFSEKTLFFHKICYAFHAKYAACEDQVHGLLADMANAKDTAVTLYSYFQPYSLSSAVCSSQPSLLACAKIFAWGKVDFGLKSPKSLAS